MNICLIGYGKMGKMVEAAALKKGCRITLVIDPFCPEDQPKSGAVLSRSFPSTAEEAGNPDVFIEFTRPETAADNIKAAAALGKPVVCGSTGWHDHLTDVSAAVEKAGTALLWSSNFSLGVNLFYRIAAYAAALADPFAEYDLGGMEIHHNKKVDSPSGTAMALMERVLAVMKRKTKVLWNVPTEGALNENSVHFTSLRQGYAPGVHSLFFDSPADTIEISHTARNREGLASGAIIAAEWLLRPAPSADLDTRSGESLPPESRKIRRGIFTMDDALKEILTGDID